MTAATDKPGFAIKGWHVLAGLIAFFGIVIAADVFFTVLAYRSFSGQVASNPYEAGLAYNRSLAEKARQDALGWTARIADADDRLELTVVDRGGAPVDGLKVTATLERPATEQGRRTLVLEPRGEGRYAAPLTLKGGWDARITAQSPDGAVFRAERRLVRR